MHGLCDTHQRAVGLQDTLAGLMERLAVDHPHHTLYQLMALANGNRGRDGRRVGDAAAVSALRHPHCPLALALCLPPPHGQDNAPLFRGFCSEFITLGIIEDVEHVLYLSARPWGIARVCVRSL